MQALLTSLTAVSSSIFCCRLSKIEAGNMPCVSDILHGTFVVEY